MDSVRLGPVKGLRIAVAAFALSVFLFVAVSVGGIYLLTHKTNEGSETHAAICALTADLESRTADSRLFLREHPHGIPGLASAAQIRESVENQERTIDALSVVSC
jgi:hypothetical protein